MSSSVRVRFAPSPTGPLHIGGVRTALFNYLFAKKHNGTFILRIEDTDQKRYVPGAEDYIIEALNWCKIPHDEGPGKDGGFGPYRQSERKDMYHAFAKALLESGNAYYAFDRPDSLDAHRKDHEAKGKTFIYNWHNREKLDNSLTMSSTDLDARIASGDNYVIRFKAPQDEILVMQDEIRGTIKIDTNTLDDKILFKSDGMPTYHLANIVDDHTMEISHVIRGEEWLPSMALHVLLYRALGWDAPKFAHLPLILKPQGKGKLSKRDGDKGGFPVFPLQYTAPDGAVSSGYREDGYLPQAVINMLALLGWNPGTEQEIFNLEELITAFDLDKVNNSGAKFDPEKTKWFQQQYFVNQSNEKIAQDFLPILQEKGMNLEQEKVANSIGLIKERAVFINDIWDLSAFFFEAPASFNEKAIKKCWKDDTAHIMNQVYEVLSSIEKWGKEAIQTDLKGWITSQEIGFGKVMMPLRTALVGSLMGPDVFDIMATIGKEDSLSRIQAIINR